MHFFGAVQTSGDTSLLTEMEQIPSIYDFSWQQLKYLTIPDNISHIVELESWRNVFLMYMIAPVIYDARGLGHACDA